MVHSVHAISFQLKWPPTFLIFQVESLLEELLENNSQCLPQPYMRMYHYLRQSFVTLCFPQVAPVVLNQEQLRKIEEEAMASELLLIFSSKGYWDLKVWSKSRAVSYNSFTCSTTYVSVKYSTTDLFLNTTVFQFNPSIVSIPDHFIICTKNPHICAL